MSLEKPTPDTIVVELQTIAPFDDFTSRAYTLVQDWQSAGLGLEAVEPILKFIENNPALDLGTPGPLVHFVERFYRHGYEQLLLDSLKRKPVPHTVWMLNRVINGTNSPGTLLELSDAMRGVLTNPAADSHTVTRASEFLADL